MSRGAKPFFPCKGELEDDLFQATKEKKSRERSNIQTRQFVMVGKNMVRFRDFSKKNLEIFFRNLDLFFRI